MCSHRYVLPPEDAVKGTGSARKFNYISKDVQNAMQAENGALSGTIQVEPPRVSSYPYVFFCCSTSTSLTTASAYWQWFVNDEICQAIYSKV